MYLARQRERLCYDWCMELDQSMIVRIRNLDDLADTHIRERFRHHRLVFGWIFDCARRNDHRLSGHEPRHRTDCADRARVGERDRCTFEVGDF